MVEVKQGRPRLLTPELQDRFLGLIRKGHYIDTARQAVGIAKQTFYNWMKRAEAGEEPFLTFREKFFEAEAEAEVNVLGVIDAAAKEAWQAAAWKAERRWPDRWARKDRQQVELTGKDGGPIVQVGMDDIAEAMSAISKNATENPEPEFDPPAPPDSGTIVGSD